MVGGLAVHRSQTFTTPISNPRTQISEEKTKEKVLNFPSLHQVKSIEEFKKLHAQYIKLGLDQVPRQSRELLQACALSEWGSIDYARSIFLCLDDPGSFEFNTMIKGFIKHNEPDAAILLYIEMLEGCIRPDDFTFPFIIKACSQLSAIKEGMQIHGHTVKLGFSDNVFVQNSLINMYGNCREIELCCKVFEQMESCRTVASWSALLAGHTKLGLWGRCLELFGMMSTEGVQAEESSMVSALSACKHLGAYDLGRSIHCSLLRRITGLNVIVQTTLLDMYLHCGHLRKATIIFDRISDKNAWTYSVMISGLALHGEGRQAFLVFSRMLKEGLEPDDAIYVGVLSACSRAGLLDEGLKFFDSMRFEYGITPNPQHYACMVDLLARAGKLKEAYELTESMPVQPTDGAWRSLLSACKTHGNLELAECVSRNLLQLDAKNCGDYINLSNMYARAKRWSDVANSRKKIVDSGLFQVPGFSTVEVKGKLHTFVSHDKSHPQSEEIYEMLYQMEWQLRFEGYSPDTSEALLEVDEDEKKKMLSAHSQKLAIAFALLNTSEGTPIRVITNLRMSRDCHSYTALISNIFEREIMVRDRNRFHIFRKGACACGDYW